MDDINGNKEAFPVLLRRVKSEPEEDEIIFDRSFEEVDSWFPERSNPRESETDLDYIITNADGEELYEFPSPVQTVTPSQPTAKKRKRKSSESPRSAKRRQRCGLCGPCQVKSNCGECGNCLRRSVLKQSCIYRKCLYLRKAKNTLNTKETLPHSVPPIQQEPEERASNFEDDTGLMPDDTAMLERPMVLLSPDSRGSPEPTISEPNQTSLLQSQDSVDGAPTSGLNTSDLTDLSSASENVVQATGDVNFNHKPESSDPIESSQHNGSKESIVTASPPREGSDSEDVQSKNFFLNTILNQDSEEKVQTDTSYEAPVQYPPSEPESKLQRQFMDPDVPLQRFPMGRDTSLKRPCKPEMQYHGNQNLTVQQDILRRKIMERSLSQDSQQKPKVVEWKKDFKTGGKLLPSWKAFGSYDRTEERHVVRGILENVSKRKSSKPKRLCKFMTDSENEADADTQKRGRSHSPSDPPEWGNACPNSTAPQPQFPGAENHRLSYPMFDKMPPWYPLQDYNMHHRDFDPRLYPYPHTGYYMGKFSHHPNQIPNDPRHSMVRGLAPQIPNCNNKFPPPYSSNKCGSILEEGLTSVHRENTPPFSKEKCNIPPDDLQRSERTLFHNPFKNFTKDMDFIGYGRLPEQYITPGMTNLSYHPDMYRFHNSNVMASPENRLDRYPFSPYHAPRMFSPWMPHGIPMNGNGPFPRPYPPFQPRMPNCVPERPVTRPPPPLRIPNFRPRSQTSSGSSGQTPTMPELERRADSPKNSKNCCEDLTSGGFSDDKTPPMDAHLKRYLDDVYKNQKCFPARPSSEPSKSSENQKPTSFECRFEQEMISIDDFHVSAFIRADGANSVEIEFDQSSIIGDHSSIGDPNVESQSSSESSPLSRQRHFSESCHSNQQNTSAKVTQACSEILINGCHFKVGLRGTVKGNVHLRQDMGNEVIVQSEIPGDKFVVENVLLELEPTSSSSIVNELIKFVTGELH